MIFPTLHFCTFLPSFLLTLIDGGRNISLPKQGWGRVVVQACSKELKFHDFLKIANSIFFTVIQDDLEGV